jgi:Transposase.
MGESAGKVMAMVFWDCKRVLLVDFMEKGTTINTASYCATCHPKTVMSSH